MKIANVENNALNWVSISSGGARDEMRHIIGSIELDVIIGSDRDRNKGRQKEG